MSSPWKKPAVVEAANLRDVMSEQMANEADQSEDRELAEAIKQSMALDEAQNRYDKNQILGLHFIG